MEQELYTLPLREFVRLHPAGRDFLKSYGLEDLNMELPFCDAVEQAQPESLREMGLDPLKLADLLLALVDHASADMSGKIGSIENFSMMYSLYKFVSNLFFLSFIVLLNSEDIEY